MTTEMLAHKVCIHKVEHHIEKDGLGMKNSFPFLLASLGGFRLGEGIVHDFELKHQHYHKVVMLIK